MPTIPLKRQVLAVLACGFLAFGAVSCGSSGDGTTASKGTEADGGTTGGNDSGTTAGGGGGATGDPCQWYTAAEMEELLGFPVTMEKQTAGANQKCVYNAPDNYSSVEITPSDETNYQNNKVASKSLKGIKPVEGVGDEAYGSGSNGATLDALKGTSSVGILIANGGGGEKAGNIDTDDKAEALAKQIAKKVLGG